MCFHKRREQPTICRVSKLSAVKSSTVATFSRAGAFTFEVSSQQFLEFPNYLPRKPALSCAFTFEVSSQQFLEFPNCLSWKTTLSQLFSPLLIFFPALFALLDVQVLQSFCFRHDGCSILMCFSFLRALCQVLLKVFNSSCDRLWIVEISHSFCKTETEL